MKVKLPKEYKQIFTLEDLTRAKDVIRAEKENDENKIEEWAEYAVNEALKVGEYCEYCVEVIRATAEVAKNYRAWNAYSEDSKDIDVWISGLAETSCGYMEFGAYLSDIWKTGSTPYRHHMYIVMYNRKEEW